MREIAPSSLEKHFEHLVFNTVHKNDGYFLGDFEFPDVVTNTSEVFLVARVFICNGRHTDIKGVFIGI